MRPMPGMGISARCWTLGRFDEFRAAAPRAAPRHCASTALPRSHRPVRACCWREQGRAHDAARMIGHARSAYQACGMAIETGTLRNLERAERMARASPGRGHLQPTRGRGPPPRRRGGRSAGARAARLAGNPQQSARQRIVARERQPLRRTPDKAYFGWLATKCAACRDWRSQDTLTYPYQVPVLRFERMLAAAAGTQRHHSVGQTRDGTAKQSGHEVTSRRAFLTLSIAVTVAPLAAAQPPAKVPRIGFFNTGFPAGSGICSRFQARLA